MRGDRATHGLEVLRLEDGATLIWEVQTRILESGTGSFDAPVPATTVSSHSVSTATPISVPAKHLVRYGFWVTGSASVSAYALFRAPQPSWQVNR